MAAEGDHNYVYNALTLHSLMHSEAATRDSVKHDLYIRLLERRSYSFI